MSEAEFRSQSAAARERGRTRMRNQPLAVAVKWRNGVLILELNNGVTLSVPLSFLKELQQAEPKQLSRVRVTEPGTAIEWPDLDEQIGIVELLKDLLGENPSRLIASELGKRGGRATSKAKAEAARANGAKGGRPRKLKT